MNRVLGLVLLLAVILGFEHHRRFSARLRISEAMSANASTSFPGRLDHPDWIEIYNDAGHPVDLTGFHLTDDPRRLTKWRFPATSLEANQFLVVLASGGTGSEPATGDTTGALLDAGFRLDSAGEYLALVAPDGVTVVDAIEALPGRTDRAYGIPDLGTRARGSDSGSEVSRAWMRVPTPGFANAPALAGLLDEPRFGRNHGFHEAPFDLTLTAPDPAATVRYTLDGSEPSTDHGEDHRGPLRIDRTSVVRAIALREGYAPSRIETRTYFFLEDVLRQSPSGEPPPGWPAGRVINQQVLDYGMDPEVVGSLHPAHEVREALLDLPTVSLALPIDDLLDPSTGIYVNPAKRGPLWERPVSVEYIRPDGKAGFQIDAGLRLRGNHSRRPENPAHAFRLIFRGRHGESRLVFPLFGETGGRDFEHLDLITSLNWSWAVPENGSPGDLEKMTMLRDVFCRDTQRAMGRLSTRSDYCHLYINGVYWGLYLTQERPSAAFAASRLGGTRSDYDVVKAAGVVVDGTDAALLALHDLAIRTGFRDPSTWYRIQGLDLEGKSDPSVPPLIDIDNLIDYMLILFHSGFNDGPGGFHRSFPNNYYGLYRRGGREGWQWVVHDAEHSLDVGELDMTRSVRGYATRPGYLNPYDLHRSLMADRQYRARFSDRAQHHLLGEGALTDRACLERLDARARQIGKAIVAHSTRWGDAARERPLTVEDWRHAVDSTRRWLRGRAERILDQLDRIGLYMGKRPPVLVESPMGNRWFLPTDGDVYYTIDGSDPRGADEKPSVTATRTTTPEVDTRVLVPLDGPCVMRVPGGPADVRGWTTIEADETGWSSARGGLGYSGEEPFEEFIGQDVESLLRFANASLQARWRFEEPGSGPDEILVLQTRCDDGFVAYLDGVPIGERGKPDVLRWNSASFCSSPGNDVDILELPVYRLEPGPHVLAVQGLNVAADDDDFLLAAGLVGRTYRSPPLPPGKIIARSFEEGRWSPPLVVPPK